MFYSSKTEFPKRLNPAIKAHHGSRNPKCAPGKGGRLMNDSKHVTDRRVKTIVEVVLLLWLVLVFILGANDGFARGPGDLPLP